MMHGPTHIKIKWSDFPVLEHKLLFMYWTYYWMGVWMKMILQTFSLSTSSAIEECCHSCRGFWHDRSAGHPKCQLTSTTLRGVIFAMIFIFKANNSIFFIYYHHKAICFFVVLNSAPQLFQNTNNHKLQDSVRLQLTQQCTTVIGVAVPRHWTWGSRS
jgi:hypothetical protein